MQCYAEITEKGMNELAQVQNIIVVLGKQIIEKTNTFKEGFTFTSRKISTLEKPLT